MAEEDFVLPTGDGNKAKAESLRVAEEAREKSFQHPSFGRQLFMGSVDWSLMTPFPRQSAEEKRIGDEFCAKLSDFLDKNLDPDSVDETRTIPQNVVDGLFELGVFAMKVPKEYDGLGFSQVNYNRAMMVLASYCGSTAVLVSAHQSIGVPEPLKVFGTPEQKQKYFPRFRKDAVSAFALTEIGVGSDPAKMEATAKLTEDGSHYILNGEKLWCTNGPIANVMVVMAQTKPKVVNGKERQQISAFIVERDYPGIEVLHRCDFMGIRGIQNGLLKFTDVKVPKENLLWKEGKGLALALKTLNTGRLTLPAACTGMAKQCLSIARRWGTEREQWGAPVALHEAGRQKVAYISSMTFAMEAMTFLTSSWADRKDIDIRFEAAMAKMFCTEAAWEIADMTLQLRGGRGYERARSLKERGEDPYPVERIMRDSRINTIIEGTSEIMRLFLAREALDPHLKRAMPLLNPRSSFGEKLGTAGKLIAFYSSWYPKQWVNGSWFSAHPELGKLDAFGRFVDRQSHKLARTLFHFMGRYREKLEKKQVVLGHLIDIGAELFAMATTCSYAVSLGTEQGFLLAEHFCSQSQIRVQRHFHALGNANDPLSHQLAKRVVDGDMKWMEEGIVWIGEKK